MKTKQSKEKNEKIIYYFIDDQVFSFPSSHSLHLVSHRYLLFCTFCATVLCVFDKFVIIPDSSVDSMLTSMFVVVITIKLTTEVCKCASGAQIFFIFF